MNDDQFAITGSGYRAVTASMLLSAGETRVTQIPASLLVKVNADQKRIERDEILRETDWTQMADAPLSTAQKTAMSTYRQQLRDLPALPGFPDVPWPVPPTLGGAAGGVGPVGI